MRTLRIVLVAEESAGIQMLRWLIEGPHAIVAVLAAASSPGARVSTVASAAERAGLAVRDPQLVRSGSFAEELQRAEVDLLLNVHSLVVADASVVDAPLIGSYNLHPGPLPEYAGLNAPSWAIYNGEPEHAVTVHRMSAGIDTGTVAYRHPIPIAPTETGLSLSLTCARYGILLLQRLVETAARDPESIPAEPQDLSRRRYFRRGAPHGGAMPWNEPARSLERLVRAADYGPFPSPWGRPRTRLAGREVGVAATALTGESCSGVTPGTVSPGPERSVRVATADEWLAVLRVELDGAVLGVAEALGASHRLEDS